MLLATRYCTDGDERYVVGKRVKSVKIYSRTSAIGAVATPRDVREDENSRFLLFFSENTGIVITYFPRPSM